MTKKELLMHDLKIYIDRCLSDHSDESDVEEKAAAKLDGILSAHSANDEGASYEIVDAVRAYLAKDDVNKRKLYSYCIDFFDPTEVPETVSTPVQELMNHAGLREDDLYKLRRFVEGHKSDLTFGQTVYKLIDKHETTAPQVYKAAMLRRQDFARATQDVNNVTKRLAWQIIIGLHCSVEEADEVLFSAGYVRGKGKFDLIMEYFLIRKIYNIMQINDALSEFDLKPFSCDRPVRDDDPLQ